MLGCFNKECHGYPTKSAFHLSYQSDALNFPKTEIHPTIKLNPTLCNNIRWSELEDIQFGKSLVKTADVKIIACAY